MVEVSKIARLEKLRPFMTGETKERRLSTSTFTMKKIFTATSGAKATACLARVVLISLTGILLVSLFTGHAQKSLGFFSSSAEHHPEYSPNQKDSTPWAFGIQRLHLGRQHSLQQSPGHMMPGNGGLPRVRFNVNPAYMTNKDVIHVMICSDSNTVNGMVALVHSILSHTLATVYFHIVVPPSLVSAIAVWLVHYFPDIVLEIIPFQEDLVKHLILVKGGRKELGSPLNFARYFLPELLPNYNGRLVYIDDDCLVRSDIVELSNTEIKQGHVAAFSPDDRNVLGAFLNFKHAKIRELGYRANDQAFNAGVFVVDMAEWRRQNISAQLLDWLAANLKEDLFGSGAGGGASQPPMLIVLHNSYTPLPSNWHVRHFGWAPGEKYKRILVARAKLLHWNGHKKPWSHMSRWILLWQHYYLPDPQGNHRLSQELLEKVELYKASMVKS